MSKQTGGQEQICGKKGCNEISARKQGNQYLCAKHYRFGQMRVNAKRRGLAVPSHEQLHSLISDNLTCPDCSRKMNWLSGDGMSSVASLQHYRDGSFGIVCRSCNTRHAYMSGDTYLGIPDDHKYCPCCQISKPRSEFYCDSGRSGELKTKSYCKVCSNKSVETWRIEHREQYNEKQREYRARRKAEGNPIRRGGRLT